VKVKRRKLTTTIALRMKKYDYEPFAGCKGLTRICGINMILHGFLPNFILTTPKTNHRDKEDGDGAEVPIHSEADLEGPVK